MGDALARNLLGLVVPEAVEHLAELFVDGRLGPTGRQGVCEQQLVRLCGDDAVLGLALEDVLQERRGTP